MLYDLLGVIIIISLIIDLLFATFLTLIIAMCFDHIFTWKTVLSIWIILLIFKATFLEI